MYKMDGPLRRGQAKTWEVSRHAGTRRAKGIRAQGSRTERSSLWPEWMCEGEVRGVSQQGQVSKGNRRPEAV